MDGTSPPVLSLDAVVGGNVKRLRRQREMTAEELALFLTGYRRKRYTRYTVADLEGRRDREVRWAELVALCRIFDVALWELVLPQGDDRVAQPVEPRIVGVSEAQPHLPRAVLLDDEPGGRTELAWMLFGLEDKNLESEALVRFRMEERKRDEQHVRGMVREALGELWDEFARLDETEEDDN